VLFGEHEYFKGVLCSVSQVMTSAGKRGNSKWRDNMKGNIDIQSKYLNSEIRGHCCNIVNQCSCCANVLQGHCSNTVQRHEVVGKVFLAYAKSQGKPKMYCMCARNELV
jgi:hypothetical protein